MDTQQELDYKKIKEQGVKGRYVTLETISGFMDGISEKLKVEVVGNSVLGEAVCTITLGSGQKKILMWSQMHGNESTTTKAVLDLINYLQTKTEDARSILRNCTLKIIPILNPDGAKAYTRANANEVDLNRDARERSQPESQILRMVYDEFKPDFCFNLHDQRTIFNVGNTPKPATVSFLAPAMDKERSVSPTREIAMQLIVAMTKRLQESIPGQIGRYDDGFNANCAGDAFQMSGTPTILFEAGHFPGDYQREKTREQIFYATLQGIQVITNGTISKYRIGEYFDIPENNKLFMDVLVKNLHVFDRKFPKGHTIGILYKEILKNDKIVFEPTLEKSGNLSGYFGHKTLNCLDPKDLDFLQSSENLTQLLKEPINDR